MKGATWFRTIFFWQNGATPRLLTLFPEVALVAKNGIYAGDVNVGIVHQNLPYDTMHKLLAFH
jgi:hypothetical protein